MSTLDVWRGIVFLICVSSLILLTKNFIQKHNKWNSKTRDYWYALFMWSLAGAAIAFEGVRQHTPFGARIVFVTAASLVTLIGLRRKGSWGSREDDDQ